jgi:hypothetical protein
VGVAEPHKTAEVILRFLIAHPGWYTCEQLVIAVNCPEEAAGPALDWLGKHDWLLTRGRGAGTRYHFKPIDRPTLPEGWPRMPLD